MWKLEGFGANLEKRIARGRNISHALLGGDWTRCMRREVLTAQHHPEAYGEGTTIQKGGGGQVNSREQRNQKEGLSVYTMPLSNVVGISLSEISEGQQWLGVL